MSLHLSEVVLPDIGGESVIVVGRDEVEEWIDGRVVTEQVMACAPNSMVRRAVRGHDSSCVTGSSRYVTPERSRRERICGTKGSTTRPFTHRVLT